MTVLLVLFALVLAFAACAWAGRLLSHHYQDRLEVVAVLVIAAAVLATLGLLRQVADIEGGLAVALVIATGGGMFAGYYSGEKA